jgi:hypothetical protein
MTPANLAKIGQQLKAANQRRAKVIESAKEAAIEAVGDGMSEVEVARALGVDRPRTLRRWLGK